MPVTFIQPGRFNPPVELALMPYRIDWPAWGPTDATVSGSRTSVDAPTIGAGGRSTAGLETSNGSDGFYWEWLFNIDAGTFTFTLFSTKYFEYGKFDVTIDGTYVTTIDLYAGAEIRNAVTTLAGLALSSGNHRLRFTAAGKNASGVNYVFSVNWFSITRTGA